MHIGVCFGSFTDKGWLVKEKNETCLFDDNQLLSMIEYSAVLYQYGEFERLYGPFPQTTRVGDSDYEWNFVSFSFLIEDPTVEDTRIRLEGGMTPAMIIITYSKHLDTAVVLCKDSLAGLLCSVVKNKHSVQDIDSHFLSMISQRINDLVSAKQQELDKPKKILSPDEIFSLPKDLHPTVLALIHLRRGTLEEIAREAEYDLSATEKNLKTLIELGYVKTTENRGNRLYFCLS